MCTGENQSYTLTREKEIATMLENAEITTKMISGYPSIMKNDRWVENWQFDIVCGK